MAKHAGNFEFLAKHDPLFLQLARGAEAAFVPDPAVTAIKLRQLGEAFAKHAAAAAGVYAGPKTSQLEVLRALERGRIIEGNAQALFHLLRAEGNQATHEFVADHKTALDLLKAARQLAVWFHRTFGGARGFKPGPFVNPPDPDAARREAEQEVARLRAELQERDEKLKLKEALAEAEIEAREKAEAAAAAAEAERAEWESFAAATEAELSQRQAAFQAQVETQQAEVASGPSQPAAEQQIRQAAEKAEAALDLSEAETRLLIDAQLRQAGWAADTETLRYAAGARPQKGKNRAIAEWPTETGPVDYVLFAGLTPVGLVEAKKKHKNVAGVLEQTKRYATGFRFEVPQKLAYGARRYTSAEDHHSLAKDTDPSKMTGAFGWYAGDKAGKPTAYRVPFLYSTNGRPFHRQFETLSGIWFLDARRPTHHARPLMGWHAPSELEALLQKDEAEAEAKLVTEPFDYTHLRPYQIAAVRAVEEAIIAGQRSILLAMATGTGKTRTTIALAYRLLKSGRIRRVLFLVDRTALGEQATNAFNEMRLDQNKTFTEIFDIKELGDLLPEASTKLHLATVQSMVKRVLETKDPEQRINIDAYDLIIVDESHRGYNLDKSMTEGEMELRGLTDYVSMYRRVLDYFDAIKVGLTATPALHTTQIFGQPVYRYGYREAVVDGFLTDHEPPVRIVTQLAKAGIHFDQGDEVKVVKPGGITDLAKLDDELDFDVSTFNRKVVSLEFTRVVCETLAGFLDPTKPGKTLIFCVDDIHADRVVSALKKAMVEIWGEIEENAIIKLTGATDKYMQQIRRFKNEKDPRILATVDLLTTGIDVPEIVNLVFVRRVRSRILYEQMLGRATRKCDSIGKEVFRIYDAVDLYSALEDVTQMKPVVTQVNIGLDQLLRELDTDDAHLTEGTEPGRTHAHDVLDQIVTKLRRAVQRTERAVQQKSLPPEAEAAKEAIEALLGAELKTLPDGLRKLDPEAARAWMNDRPALPKLLLDLSAKLKGFGDGQLISDHPDALAEIESGYGDNQKPADYLEAFASFVKENQNKIAALEVVCTRPRDLTRAQLKELRLLLAEQSFTEPALRKAWSDLKNEDIAASIIGFIRQQAMGSPLQPYAQRVKKAKAKILGMHPWNPGQKSWLERIASQLEKEIIVDEQAFSRGMFKTKGGYKTIDKQLGGKLGEVLDAFGDAVWDDGEAA